MKTSVRPHVLLITTDHWFASLLGCAGHRDVLTPNLDQLALAGTRFANAYSSCPVCIPARRTLMTGLSPKTHGTRGNAGTLRMPDAPTLAQCFGDAGYQAYAVGKLHAYPQRTRMGFDDVVLCEEGRLQHGVVDDYEIYLGERGYAGRQFAHGIANNEYGVRPWHLPDETHVTEWTTREMARLIQRRDPDRPGFWYLSYAHPHPPLTPLASYLEYYRGQEIGMPLAGEWSRDDDKLPAGLLYRRQLFRYINQSAAAIREARRAFYAHCSHIDNQLSYVIGTLREEGLLNNTIILFTSDHGDMLGDHGLWRKGVFYERSANIPMLLVGAGDDPRVEADRVDNRLVGLEDVMPTLLELAGVPVPENVEGHCMVGGESHEYLFGEHSDGLHANRMVHNGRYKLIYYPAGNHIQLFDIIEDPDELHDLSGDAGHMETRRALEAVLMERLHGGDEAWVRDGKLVGIPVPDSIEDKRVARHLFGQRGSHWPPPKVV